MITTSLPRNMYFGCNSLAKAIETAPKTIDSKDLKHYSNLFVILEKNLKDPEVRRKFQETPNEQIHNLVSKTLNTARLSADQAELPDGSENKANKGKILEKIVADENFPKIIQTIDKSLIPDFFDSILHLVNNRRIIDNPQRIFDDQLKPDFFQILKNLQRFKDKKVSQRLIIDGIKIL